MSIQVRRTRYRGVSGWLVCGRPPGVSPGHYGVSIFARTEAVARHIAARVRAGEQITGADWEGDQ